VTHASQHHYEAQCERDGRHWSIDVPDLRIHTFGRTLRDAEEMARDAVASLLEVPIEDVSVSLTVPELDEPLQEVDAARIARAQAVEREQKATADAIRELLRKGVSQRDAARMLNLSHQRVSQIASGSTKAHTPTKRKSGSTSAKRRKTGPNAHP
jgi:predicted RNase H-like HicB family nuclease